MANVTAAGFVDSGVMSAIQFDCRGPGVGNQPARKSSSRSSSSMWYIYVYAF